MVTDYSTLQRRVRIFPTQEAIQLQSCIHKEVDPIVSLNETTRKNSGKPCTEGISAFIIPLYADSGGCDTTAEGRVSEYLTLILLGKMIACRVSSE